MKTSPRSLLVFLMPGLLIASAAAQSVEPPPMPSARFAKEPGRLVGWGMLNPGDPLVLPTGAAAEGFIAVDAMSDRWIALKADGKVVTGGATKKNLIKWANTPPVTAAGKRVVDVAAGEGLMVLYDDGTLDVFGHADRFRPPPEAKDIVAITGGRSGLGALRKDGRAFVWGGLAAQTEAPNYSKTVDEQFQQNLASDVTALQCAGEFVYIEKTDGRRLLYRFPEWTNRSSDLGTEPIKAGMLALGYVHGYYQTAAGEVKGWAGPRPRLPVATKTVPSFEEPVIDLRASGVSGLARLQSGKWVTWGEDGQGLLQDMARLQNLLAFEYQELHGIGKPEARHGIVIGIAPSAGGAAAPEIALAGSAVPEVAEVLARVERERLAAGADLEAWDARYLSELTKLEAKASGKDLQEVAAEKKSFRDTGRPLSSHAELARLQKIYRDLARGHAAKRDAAIVDVYEKAAQSLAALAEGFTKAGLTDKATAVNKEKDKLATALAALKSQQAKLATAPVPAAGKAAPAPADGSAAGKKFAFTDKFKPGKLVGIGHIKGKRIDIPGTHDSHGTFIV
jgi:hypothetical protein